MIQTLTYIIDLILLVGLFIILIYSIRSFKMAYQKSSIENKFLRFIESVIISIFYGMSAFVGVIHKDKE